MDPALLRGGRFDLLFELPVPDEETRRSIFRIHTKDKPLHQDVDLEALAKRTEGMVGSDIQLLCQRASKNAIRKFVRKEKEAANSRSMALVITGKDFEAALKSLQSERP
jgi:transitional endoplasmic reticulum ATPase